MKITTNKRNTILAILISCVILFAGMFVGMFYPSVNEVDADTYNYGTFNNEGYYTIDDVVFYALKVKEVTGASSDSYWPTYQLVTEDDKPAFIKFGETVLLEDDEMVLICFARTNASGVGDDIYILDGDNNKLSAAVDYLSGTITINGESQSNVAVNTTLNADNGGFDKEFGYLINLNAIDLANEDQIGLGQAKNTDNKNYEGLIEVGASYEVGDSIKSFSFMFYAFKKSTYQRTESLNSNEANHFARPNTEIVASNYVTDSATQDQYFGEYFYYFGNQNLPYLDFDYTRYEVEITKTIHTTLTKYTLLYDRAGETTDGQTAGINAILRTTTTDLTTGKIIQTIDQNLATADVYARDLVIEELEGNGNKVRVYFSDLGVYEFSYSAVYYKANNQKVYLDTLNEETRKDRLTIFGTEMTYQDIEDGQTPFRNANNTVSADVTGTTILLEQDSEDASKMMISNFAGTIAGTNQPQISLLFNSTVTLCEVYYSTDKTHGFEEKASYAYTSNFTTPGYYYIKIENDYTGYKSWLGTSTSYSSKESTQIYYFQIKDQTPELEMYILGDDGEVSPTPTKIYSGTYVKNGVQIIETVQAGEFDSTTSLIMKKTAFGSNSTVSVNLSSATTSTLAQYGITKSDDGYYIIKPQEGINADGAYELTLRFGKAGKTTCLFKLDTTPISGIKAYTAEERTGSIYYNTGFLSNEGTLASTNGKLAVLCNEKASGAKVTIKYVRYALNVSNYLNYIDDGSYNDYIINDTWLATDYFITLSEVNPEMTYEKAENSDKVTERSVLTASGLYVFKFEDEAGNIAYFSAVIDGSAPTVLQRAANSSEQYTKVTSNNNVAEATTIFFGSHKAIPLAIPDGVGTKLTTNGSEDFQGILNGTSTSSQYLKEFFDSLDDMDANNLIQTDGVNGYLYLTIPIVKVAEINAASSKTVMLSSSMIAQGYYNRVPNFDENNRMRDIQYFYQIFDASNTSATPSRSYSLRFNTDATEITIYTSNTDINKSLQLSGSQTADDGSYRNNYYAPTSADILYLSWGNLYPDSLNAYVDLENDGLICNYYELLYNTEANSYYYSETGIEIDIGINTYINDMIAQQNGTNERLAINVQNGQTKPGKYEIVRKYTPIEGETVGNLGQDYETVRIIFFIDRLNLITSNNSNGERVGTYAYITMFDGGDIDNKEYYNLLYKQAQTPNARYVVETNELPIGFYVPVSKFGTVYGVEAGGVLSAQPISLADIQSGMAHKYVDLVNYVNMDADEELGISSTYSPYSLNVVIISPATKKDSTGKDVNVYYYYSYSDETGYFMLSGYSYGELRAGESPIEIIDRAYFINNNPIINSKEYATGTYTLQIGAVKDLSTNKYVQSFKFLINVIADAPEFDMTTQYPELDYMDDKDVVSDGINYYTNSNTLKISWTNSLNEYITPIDLSKISYTYILSNARYTLPQAGDYIIVQEKSGDLPNYYTFINGIKTQLTKTGDSYTYGEESTMLDNDRIVIFVEKDENNCSFSLVLPNGAEQVTITLTYETYSTDGGTIKYYRPYSKTYSANKKVLIDVLAPTGSLDNLIANDITVNGQLKTVLRESTDTRYNKTITTGMYKYYSFMASAQYLTDLSNNLATNSARETKYFYYRQFAGKYTSATIYETGLGLDDSATADNVFSEYFALNNGWTKVSANKTFSNMTDGYYEIVEFDFAGNMTIYTIYITNGQTLQVGFTKQTVSEKEGSVSFSKQNTLNAIISIDGELATIENVINNAVELTSYNTLSLDSIKYLGESAYRYLRLVIDGTTYFVTPFNYTNIGTAAAPNIVCTSLVKADGTVTPLSDLDLYGRATAHNITFYDSVNKFGENKYSTYSIKAQVANATSLIDNGGAVVSSNVLIDNVSIYNLALVVTTPLNPTLKIANDINAVIIYQIKSNGEIITYQLGDEANLNVYSKSTATSIINYYYIIYDTTFDTSTFYIVFKDNFGKQYSKLVEYNVAEIDRYQGNYDVTSNMQSSSEIIVSNDVAVNISNLYEVNVDVSGNIGVSSSYYTVIGSNLLGGSYKQYQLKAEYKNTSGYLGGKVRYALMLSYNIPAEVKNDLTNREYNIDVESDVLETIYVTIYNQTPVLKATTSTGHDISEGLFSKTTTQSEAITLSFLGDNEMAETAGYTSKVFLRLRGAETGYVEIESPYVVSEVGIYDVYIQNFDEEGNALDYIKTYDFVISSLDVMFYTVVKTTANSEQEVVSPTGTGYYYNTEGGYASHHYIVNTSEWEVLTNGGNVTKTQIGSYGATTVYEIESISGTTKYSRTIAITVVESTTNIVNRETNNSFIWYLGTVYSSPSADNYIRSTTKEIYLCTDDIYDQVTLRWPSYYGLTQNKITCYVSSDEGNTWAIARGTDLGAHTTLTLTKSASYLFKFVDYAGNEQLFSSSSGYPSTTTKVNFIRSVVFKLNGQDAIDNSVYNSDVTISLPMQTLNYYSTSPTIRVMRNNVEYSISKNAGGNYVFTEGGTYVVSFSAKVKGGTKDLNEDSFRFTIINTNDSRWTFNYVNYNGYTINYIKYNDAVISTGLKAYALSTLNEINISAFDQDSLGNRWFNNGIYTIKMTRDDDVFGIQSFEFSFWINDATPPISVSLPEGHSTTDMVKFQFNKANLFELIGDCYISVDNNVVEIINGDSIASENAIERQINSIGTHYIQVYTSSGKLLYSYKVQIDEPLNTITIILIVVSCVVVVAGGLIFFLLRKKMKVR